MFRNRGGAKNPKDVDTILYYEIWGLSQRASKQKDRKVPFNKSQILNIMNYDQSMNCSITRSITGDHNTYLLPLAWPLMSCCFVGLGPFMLWALFFYGTWKQSIFPWKITDFYVKLKEGIPFLRHAQVWVSHCARMHTQTKQGHLLMPSTFYKYNTRTIVFT